jgi:hypothetical protein
MKQDDPQTESVIAQQGWLAAASVPVRQTGVGLGARPGGSVRRSASACRTDRGPANAGRRYIREDLIALMWSSLGENDRALRWYERALQSNSAGIGGLYVALANEGRRRDPRILAFAKRAGLPDPPLYWC